MSDTPLTAPEAVLDLIRELNDEAEASRREIERLDGLITDLLGTQAAEKKRLDEIISRLEMLQRVVRAYDLVEAGPALGASIKNLAGLVSEPKPPTWDTGAAEPPLIERVETVIQYSATPMRAGDIAPLVGATPASVAPILGRLSQHGKIRNPHGSGWVAVKPRNPVHPMAMATQEG